MSQPPDVTKPAIDMVAEAEHLIRNNWLWFVLFIVVMVQRFILGQSLKLIASCHIGFVAFLIHHATSVFLRLSILLRHLADDLERADREDQERAKDSPAK